MYNGLCWASEDEPQGLTFFAIIPVSDRMSKSSQKEYLQKDNQIKIKNSYENNLDNDEIEMMSKQEFYFPENIK